MNNIFIEPSTLIAAEPLFELIRSGVLQPNDVFNMAYRQTMEILVEKGYSLRQIEKRLNEWGYKTKKGQEWTRKNVWETLKALGLKTQRGTAKSLKIQAPEV